MIFPRSLGGTLISQPGSPEWGKAEYFVPLDGRLRNVPQSSSWAETQRPHAVRIGVGGGLEPEGGGAVVSPLGASFITFPYYYALIILLT